MKKFVLPLLFAGCCFAGELSVEVTTDKASGIYKSGDTVAVTAVALEDGKPVSGRTVTYDLIADGKFRKRGKFVSDAAKPFVWKHKLAYPTALRAEFTILDANGKRVPLKRGYDQVRYAGGRVGAVSDPEKILPAGKRPADFDAFWQKQKARLAKVPMKLLEKKSLEKRMSHAMRAKSRAWDIKVSCVDNVPVSGVLAMPKNAKAKSHPAVLLVPGAGVSSIGVYSSTRWSEKGAICLDINAHGIPNRKGRAYYEKLAKTTLKDYRFAGTSSRDTVYFKGMYLRLMRALDYLKSRPEWDGKVLIATGGSQGGGQAIAAAALDPQVTLCVADVPAIGDHAGSIAKFPRRPGWPKFYDARNGKADPKVVAATAYYDNVFLARRIKCETYLSAGLMDMSCSPAGIYLVYKNLASEKKDITVYPQGTHSSSPGRKGKARINAVLQGK